MRPKNVGKKKLGYKQYESLLSEAHRKLEIMAHKVQELQTYFIGYVEFEGNNVKFNGWMNDRLKELKDEIQKNDKADEQHMEPSTADQG